MNLQNSYKNPKFASSELSNAKNDLGNEEFDEVDVAANAFLFFIAGFETTASTMSFCLYELSLNRDIQQKVRDEIMEVRKNNNGKITVDSLKDLNYMEMVLSETLRMYPPVPALFRICTKEYTIPDTKTTIDIGTKIMIPAWSIHHDEKYWKNPNKFDPERFSQENKANIINGTYLPFGEGPRFCIGMRFAQMELKLALAEILTKYEVTPSEKTEIPLTYKNGALLLTTNHGVWVNVNKIN